MRKMMLALLALALLATTVQAQPPSFTQAYQVRGAVGNIPLTEATEPEGSWNLEQKFMVQFDNASAESNRSYQFALPSGADLVTATCDCPNYRQTRTAIGLTFIIEPASANGLRTIRVVTSQPFDSTAGFSLFAPFEAGPDQAVILYVPVGSEVTSPVQLASPGMSTDGTATIHYATFDAGHRRPVDLWFSIHPDNAVGPAPDVEGWDDNMWLFMGAGVLVGAFVWSQLVSRGMVQRKGRKQDVATAAHVEAAAADSPAVLEGKKRALLAALKDVELARQSNEMPVEVYDVVKADLKKQAVTVMRALESGSAEPKA